MTSLNNTLGPFRQVHVTPYSHFMRLEEVQTLRNFETVEQLFKQAT